MDLSSQHGALGASDACEISGQRSRQREGSESASLPPDRVQSLRLDKSRLAPVRHRGRRYFVTAAVMSGVAAVGCLTLVLQRLPGGMTLGASGADAGEALVSIDNSSINGEVLEASGHVAVEQNNHVTARVSGVVVELLFTEGQAVCRGDVLARLEATLYDADVAEAEAQLDLAQTNLQQLRSGSRPEEIRQAQAALTGAELRRGYLQREMQRMSRMHDAISRSTYDRAESDLNEAEARITELAQSLRLLELGPRSEQIRAASAEVDRATAQLSRARHRQSYTTIVAPVDGIVLERRIELGQRVGTDLLPGCICVLADVSALEVVIDIHERDLNRVELGQPCTITPDADPQRQYAGKLQWLSPAMDRQRSVRTAKVRITDPSHSLFPDMNCRVVIDTSRTAG